MCMKNLLFLITYILMASCNDETKNQSASSKLDPILKQHMVDSMVNNTIKDAILKDTISLADCPVEILSSKPIKKEYSNYKSIYVSYKNISHKTITAIRFKWYGVNAFNEPADMGSISNGIGGGFADDMLKPGKSDSGEWNILSRDLKKVIKAWAYEVAFEDGTKWKAGE